MSEKTTEFDQAMHELDALAKSQEEPVVDELDALAKSLEEELGADLAKSKDGDAVAADPDKDKEKGDDPDKGGEPEPIVKSDEPEPIVKSDEPVSLDDELIKASEAFCDLEKSVYSGFGSLHEEFETLKKSVAALINLNVKQALAIVDLTKSRQSDMELIHKSMESLGAGPVIPNKAVLGLGTGGEEVPMTKSVSEIHDELLKAVQGGKVDAHYLSSFGTYKDVNRLPEEVRQIIGC